MPLCSSTARSQRIGWSCFAALVFSLTTAGPGGESPGFSSMRPSSGRWVKVEQGYMTPYAATIPGTKVSFQMVPVPGGKFQLGSPPGEKGRGTDEGPQVEVTLDPYWIGRCEVTWAEYHLYYDLYDIFRRFESLGVRKVTADNRSDAVTAPSAVYEPGCRLPDDADKAAWPRHPAVSMTQYAARQYTKWLSKLTGDFYRLPTEAEWEYACRAGSNTAYHFGDDPGKLGRYAWYFANSHEDTHPVGLKKPNAWGLHDMHGNASEWVLNQYDANGYRRFSWLGVAGRNPVRWPVTQYPRVVRGGSWDSDAVQCRSASRLASSNQWQNEDAMIPTSPWWLASTMHRQIGFRIVRPLRTPAVEKRGRYWDADTEPIREAVEEYCVDLGRGRRGVVNSELPAAIKRLVAEEDLGNVDLK